VRKTYSASVGVAKVLTQQVQYGAPLFTEGVFGKTSAQDDLGVEEVGAGLLRRLIPGVIQNTPNAGYYSFYPYLLWKWEQLGGDISREAFVPFYRRHESVFSVACALHKHRHGTWLTGVNGADAASDRARELDAGASELDVASHMQGYMDTALGGYGLFYAAVLQDARLITAGAQGLVDRVSKHGADVARAFAATFEQTAYARDYFTAEVIPAEVLRELGAAVCLCTVPGRSDHELLLDTFFGSALQSPAWEGRRRQRVASLILLLEFHAQRPTDAADGLAAWRRALLEPRFSDGTVWAPSHPEQLHSWRAYQLREVAVLALTTIWSIYLAELAQRSRATHAELVTVLTSWVDAGRLGFDPHARLGDVMSGLQGLLGDAYELAANAEPLGSEWRDEPQRALCRALRILMVLPREIAQEAPGFTELLDEGGSHRWSLTHLNTWLGARTEQMFTKAAGELLDALHHQHVRVALSKVRIPNAQNLRRYKGGWRDPFNFAEDDGVLRPLRLDEPFWSGARYRVSNHLLWTLGLLTAPKPPTNLTTLGMTILERYSGDA
jgi:hypothetical protein